MALFCFTTDEVMATKPSLPPNLDNIYKNKNKKYNKFK